MSILIGAIGATLAITLVVFDAIRQHKEEAEAKQRREEYLARKAHKQTA